MDLAKEVVGDVVSGNTKAVKATIFWFEWPGHIQRLLQTEQNLTKTITNSNLKMTGLLILWLVIEAVAPILKYVHAALLNDNQPVISWTNRMTSKISMIAGMLL